jgi:hypothetical protein
MTDDVHHKGWCSNVNPLAEKPHSNADRCECNAAMAGINFPRSYEGGELIAIPLGRLQIGPHVVRLVFSPSGQAKLLVPRAAIDDGSVAVLSAPEEPFGFGAAIPLRAKG